MRKKKENPPVEAQQPLPLKTNAKPLCWESFFQCQRHPVLRSQVLAALMSGTVLEVERLPSPALLDVLLLATAARETCNAEIVSDYDALRTRVEEEWSKPDWTTRVFSSAHGRWANCILKGTKDFDSPEEAYIPSMVSWFMNHDAPQYIAKEAKR